MKFTEVKDDIIYAKLDETLQRAANLGAPPVIMDSHAPPRSKGLHLSQVIYSLYDVLKPRKDDGDPYGGRANMAMGFAWEHLLSYCIAQVFWPPVDGLFCIHPGEVERDGILMSPDAVWVCEGDEFEEWKCTQKSSEKTPLDYTTWVWQMKAYAYTLGLRKARLRILHLRGGYGKGAGRCKDNMCYKTWLLEFTESELQENWDMVMIHAKEMGWLK